MAEMSRPYVGEMVHYVSWGTPVREDGTQEYASECRAAVVTEVGTGAAGLQVINPTGVFFHRAVVHDESGKPGTWHWLGLCKR